jgi:hypothetical protein
MCTGFELISRNALNRSVPKRSLTAQMCRKAPNAPMPPLPGNSMLHYSRLILLGPGLVTMPTS